MNRYYLVSFPRSGQHLTERTLKTIHDYFGLEYSYCEYYKCCNTIPCKYSAQFQKNHDFSHSMIYWDSNKQYIVLYRDNMVEQLESFFRYTYYRDNMKQPDYEDNMVYDQLIESIKNNIEYYKRFINKWVEQSSSNILKLEYSEVVKNPRKYLENLITFLDIPYLDKDIDNIIQNIEKIEYKNSIDSILYSKIISTLNNDLK
jgi:hypothetical protein